MPLTSIELEAQEWFQRAGDDLEDARQLGLTRPRSENVVWLAQQSAEKAIKAVLIQHQIKFKFIHDLELLRTDLPVGCSVKTDPPNLDALSQIAIDTRYPAANLTLDPAFVMEALLLATTVLERVRADLGPQIAGTL